MNGADTKREAAAAIAAGACPLRETVLTFVDSQGARGATDEEIRNALELCPDTSRARRCELRDAGMVRDSGRRRATASGRASIVWVAVDQVDAGRPAVRSNTTGPPISQEMTRRISRPPSWLGRGSIGGKRGRDPCPWCGRFAWWRSTCGWIVCGNCHPPAVPGLVGEWIEAPDGSGREETRVEAGKQRDDAR